MNNLPNGDAPLNDEVDVARLQRDNAYLRSRLAQAELDIADLNAEVGRLREIHERTHARRAARPPSPLGSGQ